MAKLYAQEQGVVKALNQIAQVFERGGRMTHLETGSIPAQQRARLCAACQAIKDKCRGESSKNWKSYVITSDDISGWDKGLSIFKDRKFGRG